MTKLEMRTVALEQAAAIVERQACRVCVAAERQVLGHTECWKLVQIAREIRKLGEAIEPGCIKCKNGIDRQGRSCRYCSWR